MFRQFKEKNKKLLPLKLKSALKIEQISVVLQMRFILNNVNISYYKLKKTNSWIQGSWIFF
jgi:hypothetical protein